MSNADSADERREVVARLTDEVVALRASRRRVAEAAHSERRAIERELHDGVQQHLVAIAVDLQRLAQLVDSDATAAKELLAEMRANIREALGDATKLATRTYPPIIDGRGLAAALRSAANEAGMPSVVEVPAGADYPREITAALYWTWLDAIAVASPRSEADFSALDAHGGLTFGITIPGHVPEDRIYRLRDRIEALDGRLTVDDRLDGSTRLQGWLPLPR